MGKINNMMMKAANDLNLSEISVIAVLAAFLDSLADDNPQVETTFASYLAEVVADVKKSQMSPGARAAAFEQAVAEVQAVRIQEGGQPFKTTTLEEVLPAACRKALELFVSRLNAGFVKTHEQFKKELTAIVEPHKKYAEEHGMLFDYLLYAIEYSFLANGVTVP